MQTLDRIASAIADILMLGLLFSPVLVLFLYAYA